MQKILQNTKEADLIYVVRDEESRCGFRLYSHDAILRRIKGRTWKVQLTDTDNKTIAPNARVLYEGKDAELVLSCVLPNWGVWCLTQVVKEDEMEDWCKSFGFNPEPEQIFISLKSIL